MDSLNAVTEDAARPESPFHVGEQEVQSRLGFRDASEAQGRRSIRAFMPDQHRDFFTLLPFLLVGTVDGDGWPMATIVTGLPGFVHSPDPRLLRISAFPADDDPVASHIAIGSQVGLLGIDLATRRRNRMNGRVLSIDQGGFSVAVEQSFGNCPQYIQGKSYRFTRAPQPRGDGRLERIASFGPAEQALVSQADAFFVATSAAALDASGRHGADISHRGGKSGFIGIRAGRIIVPDYAGNRFYNTLGNLAVDPRAGLLFVDFAAGHLLHLAGRASVIWDGEEVAAYRGAERLWMFDFSHGWWLKDALPLRWSTTDAGPRIETTGTWEETLAVLRQRQVDQEERAYRVTSIVRESDSVRSLHLLPVDGRLPEFRPGQFLPLRSGPADGGYRPYTISSASGDGALRISIKKGAGYSRKLHEDVKIGDILQARSPRGQFVAELTGQRPLVLLAAGIGVTPMVSMLHAAARAGRAARRILLVHTIRDRDDTPFASELARLAGASEGRIRIHYFMTAPGLSITNPDASCTIGRPTPESLDRLLPKDSADYHLCGPSAFMQAIYDCLRERGVPDADIHAEAFGPSALRRRRSAVQAARSNPPAAARVLFARSRTQADWDPASGSLLDLAEAAGVSPPSGCRSGTCGACETRILAGRVRYVVQPLAALREGGALICCSEPDTDGSETALTLDL
jgi:ferredoxin-NADP reductase/predicted pyridoxine 5'-phosphate oxidase superfamily flavin-nucleotide-binding protein